MTITFWITKQAQMLLNNWFVTVLFCESIPYFSYAIIESNKKFPSTSTNIQRQHLRWRFRIFQDHASMFIKWKHFHDVASLISQNIEFFRCKVEFHLYWTMKEYYWFNYTLAILKFLCKENAGAILKPLLISNEWSAPMAIEKIKILGAVLELPAK